MTTAAVSRSEPAAVPTQGGPVSVPTPRRRTGPSRRLSTLTRPSAPAGAGARRPTELTARARRALKPVGALGWGLLATCLLAWVVGTALHWVELRALAVAGVGTLLAAAAFTIGRSTYAVTLDLHATRVVVGERAVGKMEVRNSGARRLLPARIALPVGAVVSGFDLPSMKADDTHEELFAIPTSRRARLVVGPVSTGRGDPLGLLQRDVLWTDPVDLFVHPRTVRLAGSAAGFVRDLEGKPTRQLSNSDVSFHALRPYVAGDDRRYVHWKSSARTGTWMVRQFEETRRSHLVIALSSCPADYGDDPEEFELGVSSGGSMGLQALADEKTLSVLTSARRLRISSGQRLLDDLTVAELDGSAADLTVLARRVSQQVLDASVVVLVCGTGVSLPRIRTAVTAFGQDARVVVLRCAPGEPTRLRTIDGATVITVGSLVELPSAVRRAGTL